MKYIITESQYKMLTESNALNWVKRRFNKEIMKDFISQGEINYPTLCDDFDDEFEYADAVIDYAIDEFIGEIDKYEDIYEKDYYSDVMDYLRNLCRDEFGEYLFEIYKMTCSEENGY